MITILKRIFLRDEDLSSSAGSKKYGILCSILGIILNLILFGVKNFIGIISGSVAIIADAKNNLGDAATNIGMLMGWYIAGVEGGYTHPGGHGRMEWMVGLLTSWLVFSLGLHQFTDSIRAIRNPVPSEFSMAMIIVLIGSILVKIYMWHYNRAAGRQTHSLSMEAVAIDSLSDSISTTVVLVSILLEHFCHLETDGWCGLLVAVFIMYSGFKSLSDAIMVILGEGADEAIKSSIQKIVNSHPCVKGTHGLMVHDYGAGKKFVSLYIEGDEQSDIVALYNEADKIAYEVYKILSCECIVAVDFLITDSDLLKKIESKITEQLKESSIGAELKEFRMIRCQDHINVMAVVGMMSFRGEDAERIRRLLEGKIKSWDSQYVPIIKVLTTAPAHYHSSKIKKAVKKLFHL